MIKRILSDKLIELSAQFPVILLTGPRQSGKTTLVKTVFGTYDYVSLEDPDNREFAVTDPRGFLRRFRKGVILDEVQKAGNLLSYIQGIVDNESIPGRFVLTGSQQFQLSSKVSQTLAGRAAVVNLLPFSISELFSLPSGVIYHIDRLPDFSEPPSIGIDEILYKGCYPPIYDKGFIPYEWLQSYYQTYVERDVRDVLNIGDLEAFQRFVRLCAGRSGQLLNLSSLAADTGISHTTARNWLSVLQASFIVHILPPHHVNFAKRIIKSPKLYFFDTGLLCYLLRIRNPDDIDIHPLRGAIFETFVVSELYKASANRGEIPPLYFWRDRTGHEIDIVIDDGKKLIPVEIKSGETLVNSSFDGLRYFISLGRPASENGVLIHGGTSMYQRDRFIVRPWYACV